MPNVGLPTLEQLRVLKTVAETGSFSEAARRLNKAQSVISYAIGNLEEQLGLALFDRHPRGPVLTDAGRAIVGDARRVTQLIDELRSRAGGLQQGLEATIGLVVDVMFPIECLVGALEAFARTFPTVELNLQIEALGGVVQRVVNQAGAVGVSGWATTESDLVMRHPIGAIELVPVAAPWHPLARQPSRQAVQDEIQLVLTDRSELTRGRDYGVLGARQWRLGDLGAKHALLRAGLGWGTMPEPMVREDLRSERLVRLRLPDWEAVDYRLFLIHRADLPLGPAGAWLAGKLADLSAGPPSATAAPARSVVRNEETLSGETSA